MSTRAEGRTLYNEDVGIYVAKLTDRTTRYSGKCLYKSWNLPVPFSL
jgi:hypothetical protein